MLKQRRAEAERVTFSLCFLNLAFILVQHEQFILLSWFPKPSTLVGSVT